MRAGAGDDAVWAIQATATASPGGWRRRMDGGWRRHWRRAGAGDDAVWAIQATATASPGGVEAGGGGWTEAGGGTG